MQQQRIARGYGVPLRFGIREGTLVTAVVTLKPKPYSGFTQQNSMVDLSIMLDMLVYQRLRYLHQE